MIAYHGSWRRYVFHNWLLLTNFDAAPMCIHYLSACVYSYLSLVWANKLQLKYLKAYIMGTYCPFLLVPTLKAFSLIKCATANWSTYQFEETQKVLLLICKSGTFWLANLSLKEYALFFIFWSAKSMLYCSYLFVNNFTNVIVVVDLYPPFIGTNFLWLWVYFSLMSYWWFHMHVCCSWSYESTVINCLIMVLVIAI